MVRFLSHAALSFPIAYDTFQQEKHTLSKHCGMQESHVSRLEQRKRERENAAAMEAEMEVAQAEADAKADKVAATAALTRERQRSLIATPGMATSSIGRTPRRAFGL